MSLRKSFLVLTAALLSASSVLTVPESNAYGEFTDLQCMFDVQSRFPCNVSFMRSGFKIYFPRTGRTSEKIRYSDIIHWNYTDSSLKKPDMDLARRIGIIGLLFKKVEHQHVFTIVYRDNFGDRQRAILDFDDKQFVMPIKSALSDVTEIY